MSQSKKAKGRNLSKSTSKPKPDEVPDEHRSNLKLLRPAEHNLLLRFLVGGTKKTFRIPVTGNKDVDDLKDIIIGKVPGSVDYELAKVKGILSSIKTFSSLSHLVRLISIPVPSVLSLKSPLRMTLKFFTDGRPSPKYGLHSRLRTESIFLSNSWPPVSRNLIMQMNGAEKLSSLSLSIFALQTLLSLLVER